MELFATEGILHRKVVKNVIKPKPEDQWTGTQNPFMMSFLFNRSNTGKPKGIFAFSKEDIFAFSCCQSSNSNTYLSVQTLQKYSQFPWDILTFFKTVCPPSLFTLLIKVHDGH